MARDEVRDGDSPSDGSPAAGTIDGRLPDAVMVILIGDAEELLLMGLTGGLTLGGDDHAMRASKRLRFSASSCASKTRIVLR